jgi:hypothetical protein
MCGPVADGGQHALRYLSRLEQLTAPQPFASATSTNPPDAQK